MYSRTRWEMRNLGTDSNGGGGRSLRPADGTGVEIALDVGDELVERIAERAAQLIAGRQEQKAGDGWLRVVPTRSRPISTRLGHVSTGLSRRDASRSTTTARP